MRRAAIGLLVTATFALRGTAGTRPASTDLTVLLDFQGARSDKTVAAMEGETENIFKPSGLHLDWRALDAASGDSYKDLVVVRFKGACVVKPVPIVYDELGPLAFTYTADGDVQPFSVVECDKVTQSVRSAMWGADFSKAETLLGRALGRVVAHELVHILTGSGEHATEGVQKPALSGKQLIASSLPLSQADIERLKEKRNLAAPPAH